MDPSTKTKGRTRVKYCYKMNDNKIIVSHINNSNVSYTRKNKRG